MHALRVRTLDSSMPAQTAHDSQDGALVTSVDVAVETVDLAQTSLRELNRRLHEAAAGGPRRWRVLNPGGAHAIAVGLDAPLEVEIEGHAGYYCAGMNQHASVRVTGTAGVGLAENMMSGL